MPPDLRDDVVDFVTTFSVRTEQSVHWVLACLDVAPTQYDRWTARDGRGNTPNGPVPREHWLHPAERTAILAYHATHAPEGYRRMTYLMPRRRCPGPAGRGRDVGGGPPGLSLP